MEYSDDMVHTIRCDGCGKKLMNILVVDNTVDKTTNIQATCPFCKGNSQVVSIIGAFFQGPIGEEESNTPTYIDDMEFQSNKVLFVIQARKV